MARLRVSLPCWAPYIMWWARPMSEVSLLPTASTYVCSVSPFRGWAQREQRPIGMERHGASGVGESPLRQEQLQAMGELDNDIYAASSKASAASRIRTTSKILSEWGLKPMPLRLMPSGLLQPR